MPTTIYAYALEAGRVKFPVSFEYLARRFVSVTLVGTNRLKLTLNVDYRFTSKMEIETTVNFLPGLYQTIEIRRITSATDRLVNFTDGSILRSQDLNVAQIQAIHIAEEGRDAAENSMISNGLTWNASGLPIGNVGYPFTPTDAVNVQYVLDRMRSVLRVSPNETLSEIPIDRANKVLAFDSNRQPVVIVPSTGSSMELELALQDPSEGANKVAVDNRYEFTDPRVSSHVRGSVVPLNMFNEHGKSLVIDGTVTTRPVFLKAIQAAITHGFTLGIPDGMFTWETGITVPVPAGKKLSVIGMGRDSTKVVVDDLTKPVLNVKGPLVGFPLSMHNFSIGRLHKQAFTQQKLILIENADGFDVSGMETFNSVGWNMQFSYCRNGSIRGNLVRDGFLNNASDGIHIYRAADNIDIFLNEIRNIGDDAISVGHGLADGKYCSRIRVFANKAYNTNGLKFYGAVRDSLIHENYVRLAKYGASLNTYEDVSGLADGSSNIQVSRNTFEDITRGTGDQAGVTSLWNTGAGTANMENLRILYNTIRNSRGGIACLGQASKKFKGLTVRGNIIEQTSGAGIRTDFTSGSLKVIENSGQDISNQFLYLYNADTGDTWHVDRNDVDGFGSAEYNKYNGIWLRGNPKRLILTGNTCLNGNGNTIPDLEAGNVTASLSHYVENNKGNGVAHFNGAAGFSPVGATRWTTF